MDELKRIQNVYQARIDQNLFDNKYSLFRPGELYMLQQREVATLGMLKSSGCHSLKETKILEIGCGRGHRLADFLRWGAQARNINGVELLEEFVREAQDNYPAFKIVQASAHHLPFEAGSFDLVYQSTVFTSILDKALRQEIAAEMLRVLKPGGILLWYDFRYPNPKNKNVQPIRRHELIELFPNTRIKLRSVTLAPPLARALAPLSPMICRALEAAPPLRTHYLGIITKARTLDLSITLK